MTQKPRVARQIPDKEFDRLAEKIIRKNRELLEGLAKV